MGRFGVPQRKGGLAWVLALSPTVLMILSSIHPYIPTQKGPHSIKSDHEGLMRGWGRGGVPWALLLVDDIGRVVPPRVDEDVGWQVRHM